MTYKEGKEKDKENDLSKRIASCRRCSLRQSCTQVVVGSGSTELEIMFIGEAPGKKEDVSGVPFVGASGRLLEEMLQSVQLSRESVYITNIVKCRPPENRDPLPIEVTTCTHWLNRQIEILNPKLIVTLGRHSMNFFFPEFVISSSHGRVYWNQPKSLKKKYQFLTLYHPAAAIYNRKLRKIIFSDFSIIPKILKKVRSD